MDGALKYLIFVVLGSEFVLQISAQKYELTDAEGNFYSPGYPIGYPNNLNVEWLIRLPNDTHRVFLRFTQFSTHNNNDYVRVRDGNNSSPIVWTLSGKQSAGAYVLDVLSSGHELHVQFVTDASVGASGFYADYYSATGEEELIAFHGKFTSPNFPANYTNNDFRLWVIRRPVDYDVIMFKFSSLETEACCDNVEVRTETGILGTYAGAVQPLPAFTIFNSDMIVRLHADRMVGAKGFSADYVFGKHYNVDRNVGEILSENYPGDYSNMLVEQWRIQVLDPSKAKIHLLFRDFKTESVHDVLQIFDGSDENAPLIGNHSGSTIPPQYVSSGKFLFLRFTTDVGVTRTGFVIRHEAVAADFELPPMRFRFSFHIN